MASVKAGASWHVSQRTAGAELARVSLHTKCVIGTSGGNGSVTSAANAARRLRSLVPSTSVGAGRPAALDTPACPERGPTLQQGPPLCGTLCHHLATAFYFFLPSLEALFPFLV